MDKKNEEKKSILNLLFVKLFGGKEKLSLLEEEQMQSPFMTIVKKFIDNKLALSGLIIFLIIFAIVIIGPRFSPLDLSFSETSQENISPGFNMMKIPKEIKDDIKDISVGSTFSVGITNDGNAHVWGKSKFSKTIDMSKIPSSAKNLVKVAAGNDHILALDQMGRVHGWGNNRHQQSRIPEDVAMLENISDIAAGYQASVVLTEDGYSYFFGNESNTDYNHDHIYQGKLKKVALTTDGVFGLTLDGEAVYLGRQTNAYSKVPGKTGKIIDISATASTMAAVNEEGEVFIWGNVTQRGENQVPEVNSKITSIQGGRYHYMAITEDMEIISWGDNHYKQSKIPKSVSENEIISAHTGYYQNYAITKDKGVITWGLKGYLLGSDDLGRDIFNRLLNGGKMSMTIGAISVIISTIIGVIVGSVSGFFGGKVDIVLQRIVEIISSLPFLPFAMILSALIGNNMTSNQRITLIMVILGLLQWPALSRLVRAQVLAEREKEFVTAARAIGVREMGIVFRHVLPNVISVIIVSATLDFATCMLTEATLSYLGFGVPAPQPTWGNMLYGSNNSKVIQNFWWRWVFASVILGICVICINLTGDGLRDAIDPKSQER